MNRLGEPERERERDRLDEEEEELDDDEVMLSEPSRDGLGGIRRWVRLGEHVVPKLGAVEGGPGADSISYIGRPGDGQQQVRGSRDGWGVL